MNNIPLIMSLDNIKVIVHMIIKTIAHDHITQATIGKKLTSSFLWKAYAAGSIVNIMQNNKMCINRIIFPRTVGGSKILSDILLLKQSR